MILNFPITISIHRPYGLASEVTLGLLLLYPVLADLSIQGFLFRPGHVCEPIFEVHAYELVFHSFWHCCPVCVILCEVLAICVFGVLQVIDEDVVLVSHNVSPFCSLRP